MKGEHLFVYGTLLLPQIMQQVTGQRHFYQQATLNDYARYAIRGKRYPGITPQSGASVAGLLYLNVGPAAWRRLDYYEDEFYERLPVQVRLESNEVMPAWAYVVPPSQQHRLGQQDWSLLQFHQRHLMAFLQHLGSRRHR